MARLRVFIAVDPGKAIRARCIALQETLARSSDGVRWSAPETMHLTLLFLGDQDERDVPAVCEAVAEVCAGIEAFVVGIEGVGCFPNSGKPRTIWVGVGTGVQELVALHDALEKPLVDLGCYRREERKFTPHLTLGRVKGDGPMDRLTRALDKQAEWQAGESTIDEVLVMASDLRPEGPVHSVLSTAKLIKRRAEG
jgi:2'-5' RNA ligase